MCRIIAHPPYPTVPYPTVDSRYQPLESKTSDNIIETANNPIRFANPSRRLSSRDRMRPTQPLFKRLKTRLAFSTKEVGKGFYRGSNVGSLGAHTRYGNYIIDWRKARHYVVPDLKNCKVCCPRTHSPPATRIAHSAPTVDPLRQREHPQARTAPGRSSGILVRPGQDRWPAVSEVVEGYQSE